MFIGHYCAAFLTKRAAPALPLSACFLACQLIDLCWASFVLLGIEKLRVIPHFTASNGLDLYFMPYSHSLPAAFAWSAGAALFFWLCASASMPRRLHAAMVIALAVGSHWLLDLIVHVPDLPLWPGMGRIGFGLWNFPLAALLLELAMLWAALLVAVPTDGGRRRTYLLLGAAMSAVQLLSLVMQPATPVQVAAQLMATYLALCGAAFWADRPAVRIASVGAD